MNEKAIGSEDAGTPITEKGNPQTQITTELSVIEKMKILARKYVGETNWVLLDCLIVWLHNGSGATARGKYPNLVLSGMMQDFSRNLRYRYSPNEISKAIEIFEGDLRAIGIDLLYGGYYAMKREIMPQIAEVMTKITLGGTLSEEERRLVFIFAKYCEADWNPAYGILPTDLETFIKSLKGLYNGIFVDDLRLEHPEECLRRLGLVLEVDWVRSKHPENSGELVVADWTRNIWEISDNYAISSPREVDRVEDYFLLLNQKELVPQLVFYDLMLEKDTYGQIPFFKNEVWIKEQMELLTPGSSNSIPFRSGICQRVNGHLMLSPLAKGKIAEALDRVKRERTSSIIGKIVEVLDILELKDKLSFDVRIVLDFPRVWRIDGLRSSLIGVVMPWFKPSDAQFIHDLSQKGGTVVIFAKDQKMPIPSTMFGDDPKVTFCFVNEGLITYTSPTNELFQSILDQFAKFGNQVRLVVSTESIRSFQPVERKPEGAISEMQLSQIIAKGENENVEFKKVEILSNPYHLARSMAAIANSGGGLLLIGVSDDGQIQKIRLEKKHAETIINVSRTKIDPPIRPIVYPVPRDDLHIYVIEIPGMCKRDPHYVRSKDGNVCFIRVGSTVREPSHEERRQLYDRD